MGDYSKLQALAEAATPGEWARCDGKFGGVVYGGPIQHWVNGSGQSQIVMTTGAEWMRPGENEANADFIAAANPTAVLELIAEVERLSLHSHCHLLRAQTVEVERDQLQAENDRLKQEIRLLTEHNEFLASSDSRLAPELRAVKDALGLDFTASVIGEVVPLIERLRKLPTCWTEVLEQSEANDQLLDQVLELSRDADRLSWLDESAEVDSVGPMRCCGKHLPSLREAIDAAMALEKSLTQ